jgi:hypothetical protein
LLNQRPGPILFAINANPSGEKMVIGLRKSTLLFVCFVSALSGIYLTLDVLRWTSLDWRIPRESIVSDVIARRTTQRGFRVDVSDIVNRYITIGEPQANIVRNLKALGFDIHIQLAELGGAEVLTALRAPLERTIGNYLPLPIYDELRITVHFFDERVFANSSGEIIYRYL